MQFKNKDNSFDTTSFEHAVKLWTLTLEISVLMAQFPSKEIAQNSFDYRTLGLGFANIIGKSNFLISITFENSFFKLSSSK